MFQKRRPLLKLTFLKKTPGKNRMKTFRKTVENLTLNNSKHFKITGVQLGSHFRVRISWIKDQKHCNYSDKQSEFHGNVEKRKFRFISWFHVRQHCETYVVWLITISVSKFVASWSFLFFCKSFWKIEKMNVISAVKLYIEKMANEAGPGLKILLMDKETVSNMLAF